MKYDLIVSDFDGTMADKKIVSEQTLQAIKRYVAKGGKFVICTGRVEQSIKSIIDQYGLPTVSGTHQGSRILDTATGEVLKNGGIDYKTAIKVVDFVRQYTPVVIYIGPEMFAETPCRYAEVFKGICDCTYVPSLTDLLLERKDDVNRIIASTVPERVPELLEFFGKHLGDKVLVNSGANYIVEMASLEHNKKTCVEFLANYYGIPFEKVMTVGDSTNDIPLLCGKWQGVAVGSAHEKLKEVAKEITVPISEHPIKYLIEKYCLED